jgi:hypothetical protein
MTQLRAATRLAQAAPESDRPRHVEALRAIRATFTEGFETRDLVEARRVTSR